MKSIDWLVFLYFMHYNRYLLCITYICHVKFSLLSSSFAWIKNEACPFIWFCSYEMLLPAFPQLRAEMKQWHQWRSMLHYARSARFLYLSTTRSRPVMHQKSLVSSFFNKSHHLQLRLPVSVTIIKNSCKFTPAKPFYSCFESSFRLALFSCLHFFHASRIASCIERPQAIFWQTVYAVKNSYYSVPWLLCKMAQELLYYSAANCSPEGKQKSEHLLVLAFFWCTSRDSNPGPAD